MQHTIQINTTKLDAKFLTSIKSIFGKKDIKIIVEDVESSTPDLKHLEVKRFLDHRKNRPSEVIADQKDFNDVINDINL